MCTKNIRFVAAQYPVLAPSLHKAGWKLDHVGILPHLIYTLCLGMDDGTEKDMQIADMGHHSKFILGDGSEIRTKQASHYAGVDVATLENEAASLLSLNNSDDDWVACEEKTDLVRLIDQVAQHSSSLADDGWTLVHASLYDVQFAKPLDPLNPDPFNSLRIRVLSHSYTKSKPVCLTRDQSSALDLVCGCLLPSQVN